MGIGREIYDFEKSVLAGVEFQSLCDFGAQTVRKEIAGKETPRKDYPPCEDYLAIDISGQDGAFPLDLRHELITIYPELHHRFDVVTNYGTIEHVTEQPPAFVNMHNMCKVGGYMIHAFMVEGFWKDHGIWKYSETFGYELCDFLKYRLIATSFVYRSARQDRKMHLCAYQKPDDLDLSSISLEKLFEMGLRYK